MLQLIYASTAAPDLAETGLGTMIKQARARNEQRAITGMLVYRNGSFLHVLEGPEDAVRALYSTIRADDRHRWVTLLKTSPLDTRDFPDTPLAFRDRSLAGARRHGGGHGGSDQEEGAASPGSAHETLVQFQRASERRGNTAS